MLGVVDDALALRAQKGDRVGDHAQVLLGIGVDHLLEVQLPGLADQRADRREALGRAACSAGSSAGRDVAAAGHAEGADRRVLEALALEQLEELRLLGVGAREAGLDEVDAEVVERMRDAQLLGRGQGHALALHAVAESRVV